MVAIGNFDGVHRGHRAVIAAAIERARPLGRPAAALTFEPHPRSFFRPRRAVVPADRGGRQAAAAGRDRARRRDRADLRRRRSPASSAEDFVADILVERLRVTGAVIGFDFHFGKEPQRLAGLPGGAGRPARLRGRCGAAVQRRRPAGVVRRDPRRARGRPRRRGRRAARLSLVRDRRR